MRKLYFLAVLGLSVLLSGAFVSAQEQAQAASPLTIRLQPFLSGLSSPLYLTNARDGTKRLFVVQQGGIIKVVQPGTNAASDFINISPKVVAGGEQGLLGLAFHPQFAANGYFFVNYTNGVGNRTVLINNVSTPVPIGATVIARYRTFDRTNAVGDPNSESVVLVIPQPYTNHNGGMIEFRRDGSSDNLYIGMGDGGSGNDPQNRAQNPDELLGKFLRITPSVADVSVNQYSIPSDNPFVGVAGADEIYAVGVRNPFRWSFDRGGTHQLWAGDVGQGAIEETDIINKGGNYGWRVYEGNQCTNNDPSLCNAANYIAPVFQYTHAGGRCSITGGYVYRGTQGTLPNGAYIYGDYCTGEILMWQNNQQTLLQDTPRNIPSFGEDEDGELYAVGLGGTVEKIVRARANSDFDGDFKTDFSVFRPSSGVWYVLNSADATVRYQPFGLNGDIPTPEDFDGDNVSDIAVWRPSTGVWYIYNSNGGTVTTAQFGVSGDIPAAGDFDGDARANLAIYRPSTGIWYIARQTGTPSQNFDAVRFGLNGDKPVAGDYDGDGKYDIALWRASEGNWYWLNSTNNAFNVVHFGLNGDAPAPGDFDGDGRFDQAVFRPSTGVWYVLQSSNGGFQGFKFGVGGDVPAVGDYDNDGRDDIGIFRPTEGSWYVLRSANSAVIQTRFGANGDAPAPTYDAP